MRIIYVAKHDSGGNDDEGAITHALTVLGHDVQRLREDVGFKAKKLLPADLLLFHKWDDVNTLRDLQVPKAFWYFDLVEWLADPTLSHRCEQRVDWMQRIMPLVDMGFCTDGDWTDKYPDKLVWLPQGADERYVGRGQSTACSNCGYHAYTHDILFTGIGRGGGTMRESFVDEMQATYGDRFLWVRQGVHGRAMADLIARAKIVVAPDSPVTDRYTSNRVYNALGFGAFLLHPRCDELERTLPIGWVGYGSRDRMHQLIATYLEMPGTRELCSNDGLRVIQQRHLYRHRCEELIRVVKERL